MNVMLESALSSAFSSYLNTNVTPMNSDSYDWSSDNDDPEKEVTKHTDILDITEPQVCCEVPCKSTATRRHLTLYTPS